MTLRRGMADLVRGLIRYSYTEVLRYLSQHENYIEYLAYEIMCSFSNMPCFPHLITFFFMSASLPTLLSLTNDETPACPSSPR